MSAYKRNVLSTGSFIPALHFVLLLFGFLLSLLGDISILISDREHGCSFGDIYFSEHCSLF